MEGEPAFTALEDTLTNLDTRHCDLVSHVGDVEGGEELFKLVQDLRSVTTKSENMSKGFPSILKEREMLEDKLRDSFKVMTCQFDSCFGDDPDYKLDLELIKDKSESF